MKILVTGSLGCIGSEAVKFYLNNACQVIGIDNDMRKHCFGSEASVVKNRIDDRNYQHHGIDISKIEPIIEAEKPDAIIHAAAQTSLEWSIKNPLIDFGINAYSTLMLLEMTKKHIPDSPFVFLANNDNSDLSPLQVSKWAAELYTLAYTKHYGLITGIFKCSNVLSRAGIKKEIGSDPIHARDLVGMIDCFIKDPDPGKVYLVERGNLSFLTRYPDFKLQYNEWAIMEDLRQ